jgi:hypothetical protein
MPLYDFSCSNESCNHTEEHFYKYNELPDTLLGECGHTLHYKPSFWYNSQARRFDPVVIHRDALGNVRFPGSSSAPVPEGFQRVELTDFHQIRQFEKEINQRDVREAEHFRNTRQAFLDGQLKENRRVMEGELLPRFTQRGRKFYDAMRQVSEQRRLAGTKSSKPEFHVEAFSMDSSNREIHTDIRNGEYVKRGK